MSLYMYLLLFICSMAVKKYYVCYMMLYRCGINANVFVLIKLNVINLFVFFFPLNEKICPYCKMKKHVKCSEL